MNLKIQLYIIPIKHENIYVSTHYYQEVPVSVETCSLLQFSMILFAPRLLTVVVYQSTASQQVGHV